MKRQAIVLAAIFFIGTIALYGITASYGLINLDDYQYTASNTYVSAGLTSTGIVWAFESVDFGIWMPLTWCSYMMDFTFFGGDPGAMHVHNVILHACNTLLLFGLLWALFLHNKQGLSAERDNWQLLAMAVATVCWSWHPLRVESVVWVASRKDLLFSFWYLLALILWEYRLQIKASPNREAAKIVALSCFVLSCMSKPSAMTFPLVAVLCEWMMTRRVCWREYRYIGVLAVVIGLLAAYAQQVAGAKEVLGTVPVYARLLNASAAFGVYCWKTLWPSDLAVQCLHRWPEFPRFGWQGIGICIAYGFIVVYYGGRANIQDIFRQSTEGYSSGGRPITGACNASRVVCGMGIFLIAVAPTLGVSAFGYHAYADRFTYLPSIGWSVLIAAWLTTVKRQVVIASFCGVIVLGCVSWHQIQYWRNEDILFKHTLAVDGERNPMAHGALALYYYEHEYGSSKALEHFNKAYQYFGNKPFDFMIQQYIEVLSMAKQTARARDEIRAYMERERVQLSGTLEQMDQPIHTTGLSYLLYACVNMYEGDYALAGELLERGAKFQPDLIEINYLRGRLAALQGRQEEAKYHWEKCIDNRSVYVKYRFLKQKGVLE